MKLTRKRLKRGKNSRSTNPQFRRREWIELLAGLVYFDQVADQVLNQPTEMQYRVYPHLKMFRRKAIELHYADTYSKLPDSTLLQLSLDRESLIETAREALDIEIKYRGLSNELLFRSNRAYEVFGGVVVTDRKVRVPHVCPRCLDGDGLIPVGIRSLDGETHFRFAYLYCTYQVYEFFFCVACSHEVKRETRSEASVTVSRYPTTQFDHFRFCHPQYQELFLRMNE